MLVPKGGWETGRFSCGIPGKSGKDGSLGLQFRKCQEEEQSEATVRELQPLECGHGALEYLGAAD